MPGDFDNLFADGPNTTIRSGILEILPGGWGFLHPSRAEQSRGSVYVLASQIQSFSLTSGDAITGQVRPPKETEKHSVLVHIEAITSRADSHNP